MQVGLAIRGFVTIPAAERIGRLIDIQSGRAIVRITYSLTKHRDIAFDSAHLARAGLEKQTHVYALQDDGGWVAGRVLEVDAPHSSPADGGLLTYEVQFPNGREELLSEDQFEVRAFVPAEDPTDVLAAGGAESQYLHDRRLDALRAILRMRERRRVA